MTEAESFSQLRPLPWSRRRVENGFDKQHASFSALSCVPIGPLVDETKTRTSGFQN